MANNYLSVDEEKAIGKMLFPKLASTDELLIKEAAGTIETFIRKRLTEGCFFDKVMAPVTVGVDDLYKHPSDTSKLYMIVELEPDFPGVFDLAFNSTTPMATMGIRRALTSLSRVQTIKISKEIIEMMTNSVSLRDLNADMQMKMLLRKIDGNGINACNICVGKPGQVMATTGSVHNYVFPGDLTPHNWAESLNLIPKIGYTSESGLTAQTALMNTVTFLKLAHWQYQEAGPTIGTDVIKNGPAVFQDGVFGLKIVTTIKRRLIPDGIVYHFADPRFIGQQFVFQEPTLHVKQMDHTVQFYVDAIRGGAIFVHGGIVKVNFSSVA